MLNELVNTNDVESKLSNLSAFTAYEDEATEPDWDTTISNVVPLPLVNVIIFAATEAVTKAFGV